MRARSLAWLLCLVLPPGPAAADEIPVRDFARDPDVTQIKISPDGKYLAQVRLDKGADYLAVQRLADGAVTEVLNMGGRRRVAEYWWANPGRIVVSFAEQDDFLAQPFRTGELVAIDADRKVRGSAMRYLFGYRCDRDVSCRNLSEGADARIAEVIRTLPDDPRHAIVSINEFSGTRRPGKAEVARLDVDSGWVDRLATAPIEGPAAFLTDTAGIPRYVMVEDQDLDWNLFVKADAKADWTSLPAAGKEETAVPLKLSADGQRAYLLAGVNGAPQCLVEQDLASGAQRALGCDTDGTADANAATFSFDGKEPIALLYPGAPPWERLLDTAADKKPHLDAQRLARLMEAFPGQVVWPVSATRDGKQVILLVYSDRNPGQYFLFDSEAMHASFLANTREWIDPERMSEQKPVAFKARDGQAIHGLLTLPRGREPKNLPLVVNPHGGPFGILDRWGWDGDAQLLASRGYAVLQVNFRGSGGYGRAFENAGHLRWDSVMIDDITDGARWAAQQGYADAARICIYGASYGGYAALMSALREPDLYRCVIDYAGIYDLPLWKRDTDASETQRGRTFIAKFVGATAERLKAASPSSYIDRLRAPIMVVHGKEDLRVPYNQAKALRDALEERQLPYEWLVKPGEGHGFFKEENRVEFYEKLLAFLDHNIGATAKAAAAPPTAQ